MRLHARSLIALVALFAGCKPAPVATEPPAVATYTVRGVLQKPIERDSTALIAHEEIPGYMMAMTMPFTAESPAELRGLQPGDVLTFELRVTERESRISRIKRIGHTPVSTPAPPRPAPDWAVGQELPDAAFIDDSGHPLRLQDYRGRALAITFIFTRCPLPDFCLRMNAHFSDVHRQLSQMAPNGNWALLSITLDPAYDTPERLAAYASAFRTDATHWKFATGERPELERAKVFLGLDSKGEGGDISHNLRTAVVDASGRVRAVFEGNEWTPGELVESMQAATH